MPDLLPPGPGLAGGSAVELEFLFAAYELHLGACFMEQSSQVKRGSAAPDDNHAAVSKRLNVTVTGAVRQEFWRQICQHIGNVFEMSDPYSEHDLLSCNGFAILEPKTKSLRHLIDTDDKLNAL